MVLGHGSNGRNQFLAHVFGDGLLVDLKGEMVAALGRVFVERTLQEVESGGNLVLELFLTGGESQPGVFFHECASLYAYITASKSASQQVNCGGGLKTTR